MFETYLEPSDKPLGYRALIEGFDIRATHYRWSYLSKAWKRPQVETEELILYFYDRRYDYGDDPFHHIEFALKHEGLNLLILTRVLKSLSIEKVTEYILEKPIGKYHRMVWYLYEVYIGKKLSIEDLKGKNSIKLLDPKAYYTAKGKRSSRHGIIDNLLGGPDFCPFVRKSATLTEFEGKELEKKTYDLKKKYDSHLITRAMQYFYTKETLASWEIEREVPEKSRLLSFVSILRKVDQLKSLSKTTLIALQKEIVDTRFALDDYRGFQNYVGEEPGLNQLFLHYISPRPQDLEELMGGLLESFQKLSNSKINAVIAASIFSFGFVFMHPFWDGNGRLHRFIIHFVLSLNRFTPKEVIFPISAVIVRNQSEYDRILESFSKPLLENITEYEIDESGEMTVHQDTADYYRFIDFTKIAEYLFGIVERTITSDFEKELMFLTQYDKVKKMLLEVVEMPDQRLDLFIRCVRQNNGTLSARKREKYFSMLKDEEVSEMENVLKQLTVAPPN